VLFTPLSALIAVSSAFTCRTELSRYQHAADIRTDLLKRLKRETESSRSAVSVAVDAEDEAEAVAVSSSGTTRPPSSGKQKSASAAVPAMKAAQQWSGRLKIPAAY